MDDFSVPLLSSLSWTELNTPSRSSWADTIASNGLLTGSVEAYGREEKNPSICMIPSSHVMGNVAAEDLDLYAHIDNSSVFTEGNLKYLSLHELPTHNSHPQNVSETHENNFSLKDVFESSSTSGSYGCDLNTSCSVTLPHCTLTMSSSIESNGSEPSKFAQSFGDAHSISSIPSMWPPAYPGVSSFLEQGKLQGFGFQGVESNADELDKTFIENNKYPHLNNAATASLHDCNGLHSNFANFDLGQQMKLINGGLHSHQQVQTTYPITFSYAAISRLINAQAKLQEQNELHNLHLPSFTTARQMNLSKSSGVQARQQSSQSIDGNTLNHQTNNSPGAQQQATPANTSASNGTSKPRVRARRGQATDPHSIAERLRREKIAERMKNLQELVPNSNKTDKASMLDEIIDYVKFLQLQVKVLSMSRLGAAGAVVPLITDSQAEGTGALHLSSVSQGGADLSEAQDNLAFEQEVVKLMESNVTTAMQYLQNKALCLMPIALASAICSQKGSSSAAIPPDRRKSEASHGMISPTNGQSLAERINGGHIGCNGGVIKKEEAVKFV